MCCIASISQRIEREIRQTEEVTGGHTLGDDSVSEYENQGDKHVQNNGTSYEMECMGGQMC